LFGTRLSSPIVTIDAAAAIKITAPEGSPPIRMQHPTGKSCLIAAGCRIHNLGQLKV
jgi:hypothetical protein